MLPANLPRRAGSNEGFNLIEAAIVLGIVGLVIGGIWAAASMAYSSMKQQTAAKGVVSISQALKSTYNNVPTTTTIDSLTDLIASNVFPKDWMNGATAVKSPFGGAVTVGGTVGATTLSLAALDRDQCTNLATRIANSGVDSLLRSINAGGTALTNGGSGTVGFGSVSAASALAACPATTNNTLVFTFDLSR